MPLLDPASFTPINPAALHAPLLTHPPRILLLYGSLRERSFSRLLTFEAERLLSAFGAETRVFDPAGLPMPDAAPTDHPKVKELHELFEWSEGRSGPVQSAMAR